MKNPNEECNPPESPKDGGAAKPACRWCGEECDSKHGYCWACTDAYDAAHVQ